MKINGEEVFVLPISNEYEKRGCRVTINAYSDPESVDITVKNLKTGCTGSYRHILFPGNTRGYSDRDMKEIQDNLNNLLDQYGEPEWNEIHFTNQILS